MYLLSNMSLKFLRTSAAKRKKIYITSGIQN